MTEEEFGGPLVLGSLSKEQMEEKNRWMLRAWEENNALIKQSFPADSAKEAEEMIRQFNESHAAHPIYLNNKYQIQVRKIESTVESQSDIVWLSIKRLDRQPIHDWRAIQEIKNQLVGRECEGIEIYPAESRRVDTANQYHLWCFSDPTFRFPLGFNDGRHVDDSSIAGSVNRPVRKD